MKALFKIASIAIIILFISCIDEVVPEVVNDDTILEQPVLDIPEDFDFKTHDNITLILNDSEDRTLYKIYTQFRTIEVPDEEAQLEFDEVVQDGIVYKSRMSGMTKNGVLELQLKIPTYNENIFIRRKGSDGFTEYVEPITGNTVTLTHSKKAIKSRIEYAAKDKEIDRNLKKDIFIKGDAEAEKGLNSNGFDIEVTGELKIDGNVNLSGTTTIIAKEIEIDGNVNLNGATIYAQEIEIEGRVNGPGFIYYCDEYEVDGRVNQNQGEPIFQKNCGEDDDDDGVSNGDDSNSDDDNEAFVEYVPSQTGYATLIFEDLWPSFGDYDFNDVAIRYRANIVMNSDNEVVRIDFKTKVISNGAGFTNGFGIELEDVKQSDIKSVTGAKFSHNYIDVRSNGTENKQKNAVIIFTDDQDNFTEDNTVSITFKKPMRKSDIGDAPFNPFIIKDMQRSFEIHLPYFDTTDLGDKRVRFDGVNRDSDGNFISDNGYPWALSIPEQISIPREKIRIDEAYNFFRDWALSGGTRSKDWYKAKSGYRNVSKLK